MQNPESQPKLTQPQSRLQPQDPPQPQNRAEQEEALRLRAAQAQIEARAAQAILIPSALSDSVGSDMFSPFGAQVYFETVLRETGDPTDPIERMLVRQMVLAEQRVASLHAQASMATSIEAQTDLSAAATRLPSEMRRLALAIRDYRAPIGTNRSP